MESITDRVLLRLKDFSVHTEDIPAIERCVDMAREKILREIGWSEMPAQLLCVWTDMAAGYFLQQSIAGTAADDQGALSGITEGDVSLSYRAGTSQKEQLLKLVEGMINPPKESFAALRRLSW